MRARDFVQVVLLGSLVGAGVPTEARPAPAAAPPGEGPERAVAGAGAAVGVRAAVDSVPTPVLLVPGWNGLEEELAPLRARFIQAGWPPGRVASMEFDDPVGSNRAHAAEVAAEARALREVTGVDRIDVVAHSMGGLAVRHHLAFGGGEGVRKVVFLATPHRGTVSAHLAWGPGSEEMEPGSAFLDSLNARSAVPDGIRALTVRTPVDLRVVPGASAVLFDAENVRNVEICCPTHAGLLDHHETFRVVAAFLRGEKVGPSYRSEPRRPARERR